MAATSQTTSRLQLLQARFQQRQLQEKEQKLLQMYDQQQQRALQVAKRGSASSSSSNGSVHKISSTSVRVHRQTFDDKRQSSTSSSSTSSTGSVKGIDKSYPLEPLKSKLSNSNGRTVIHQNSSSSIITNGGTSSVKRGTNGVQSTASFRRNGTGIGNLRNQDVRASARAAATTTPQVIHGIYTEVREQHNALARKASKAAYDRDETDRVDRRDSGSFGERHNGHAAEYEINIDEVIDNDAMQRNRMVARVSNGQHHHARRRPSATMDENQQILANPRDEHSTAAGKTSLSRKSSTAASELSTRNAKNAATSKRSNLVSTGSSNGDLSRGGAASGEFKENGGPGNKRIASYASTKNSSNGNEQKDPSASTKSGSLKFLSKIVGSNGDVSFTTNHHTENTAPLPRRKLSSQAAPPDSPTSHEPASRKKSIDDHQHQQFQQQRQSSPAATPAPRFGATGNNSSTSSQQSSGSTLASSASRSHGSIGSRIGAGSRGSRGGAAPTPASRTSIVHEGSKQNDDSLSTCKICNRRFNIDRIGLHEQICSKTAQKKRKQFDASTHRVKGTELESFVQKPGSKSKLQSKSVQKPEQPKPPTSNWRRKHEDFISAIRSAKQMTAHIAAGGKLSDLPPPPPSDTSDYVQCPHCSRKFNQGAAERHIPKCESMQHNKPKAQPRTIKR